MEYLYHSYTRLIDDKLHYFVKRIMTFPEFQGVPDVQVGYGMHTSFEKACQLSGIYGSACRKQILFELEQRIPPMIPKIVPVIQIYRPQKPRVKYAVQITEMVNRWLTERAVEALN